MAKVHGATVIARPVEEVFDFVADERNEPRYNPRMVRVEKVTPGPIGAGTRWSAAIESRGRTFDMLLEVTEYSRPNRLGTFTHAVMADIVGALTFEPDPAGTRMTWSWDVQPRGVWRFLGPLVGHLGRRQEQEIWAGLKRYLEATSPTQGGGPSR